MWPIDIVKLQSGKNGRPSLELAKNMITAFLTALLCCVKRGGYMYLDYRSEDIIYYALNFLSYPYLQEEDNSFISRRGFSDR